MVVEKSEDKKYGSMMAEMMEYGTKADEICKYIAFDCHAVGVFVIHKALLEAGILQLVVSKEICYSQGAQGVDMGNAILKREKELREKLEKLVGKG